MNMTALALRDEHQIPVTREQIADLFGGVFGEAIRSLPPEIADLSQSEIEKLRKPSETDQKLRENLWILVENAQKCSVSEIPMLRIYETVMTPQGWDAATKIPLRIAWITTRPVEDKKKMETLLTKLLQKIENEVLPQNITDDNIGAVIKLVEFLTNRVHGSVVQKVDGRHLHAHAKVQSPSSVPQQDHQKQLGELKDKLIKSKDVTPVPVSNAD